MLDYFFKIFNKLPSIGKASVRIGGEYYPQRPVDNLFLFWVLVIFWVNIAQVQWREFGQILAWVVLAG